MDVWNYILGYRNTLKSVFETWVVHIPFKGNMNTWLVSTLYRVYVPTSICTKSTKYIKSIDLVIPHYIAPYSLSANIHICRAESKQRVKDDIDKISRLPRQDEEQHSGSHFHLCLIC